MSDTAQQFDQVINKCKDIFLKKAKDYGASWRVLRTISVIDQINIKALRIRNLQEVKQQKVSDDIPSEFMGIVNYAVIGMIQLKLEPTVDEDLSFAEVENRYNEEVNYAKKMMLLKNHDYGEAWRNMSMESFVDLILAKLLRMKQIIQNNGETLISEGLDANYTDILNYAAFALIFIEEGK